MKSQSESAPLHSPELQLYENDVITEEVPMYSPRLSKSTRFSIHTDTHGRSGVARQDNWFDSVQKKKDDMARAVDETRRRLQALGWQCNNPSTTRRSAGPIIQSMDSKAPSWPTDLTNNNDPSHMSAALPRNQNIVNGDKPKKPIPSSRSPWKKATDLGNDADSGISSCDSVRSSSSLTISRSPDLDNLQFSSIASQVHRRSRPKYTARRHLTEPVFVPENNDKSDESTEEEDEEPLTYKKLIKASKKLTQKQLKSTNKSSSHNQVDVGHYVKFSDNRDTKPIHAESRKELEMSSKFRNSSVTFRRSNSQEDEDKKTRSRSRKLKYEKIGGINKSLCVSVPNLATCYEDDSEEAEPVVSNLQESSDLSRSFPDLEDDETASSVSETTTASSSTTDNHFGDNIRSRSSNWNALDHQFPKSVHPRRSVTPRRKTAELTIEQAKSIFMGNSTVDNRAVGKKFNLSSTNHSLNINVTNKNSTSYLTTSEQKMSNYGVPKMPSISKCSKNLRKGDFNSQKLMPQNSDSLDLVNDELQGLQNVEKDACLSEQHSKSTKYDSSSINERQTNESIFKTNVQKNEYNIPSVMGNNSHMSTRHSLEFNDGPNRRTLAPSQRLQRKLMSSASSSSSNEKVSDSKSLITPNTSELVSVTPSKLKTGNGKIVLPWQEQPTGENVVCSTKKVESDCTTLSKPSSCFSSTSTIVTDESDFLDLSEKLDSEVWESGDELASESDTNLVKQLRVTVDALRTTSDHVRSLCSQIMSRDGNIQELSKILADYWETQQPLIELTKQVRGQSSGSKVTVEHLKVDKLEQIVAGGAGDIIDQSVKPSTVDESAEASLSALEPMLQQYSHILTDRVFSLIQHKFHTSQS